jgi:hypothetical protein
MPAAATITIGNLDELREALRRIALLQAAPPLSRTARRELEALLRALSEWRERQMQLPAKPLPGGGMG